MDNIGGFRHSNMSKTVRRRRSNMNRRPSNESQSPQDYHDSLPSDHLNDAPSDDSAGHDAIPWRKKLNLNHCISRASYTSLTEAETVLKNNDEYGGFGDLKELMKSSEDDLAAANNWKSMKMKDEKTSEIISGNNSGVSSDGAGNENKVKKVRLKVGGVTRTIHSKSSSDGSSVAGTSSAKSSNTDPIYPHHKLSLQDNLLKDGSPVRDEKGGLLGVPWKDFSRSGFSFGRVGTSQGSIMEADKYGRTRENKYVSRKSSFDEASEEEEDDDEIRYLQKLKTSRMSASHNTEHGVEPRSQKLRRISGVMDRDLDGYDVGVRDYNISSSGKESKKPRPDRVSEDTDYAEDEESVSDGELETKNKKQLKESFEVSVSSKGERAITTRRQALQKGRDISMSLDANFIEFPNGLPPAPPRKQKEKLSEMEHQLKRAEAAQRRRIQNEKAARESEAEAIRKILGQDSSRKRREEKIKKRKEQLAQERAANATVASNVVRWVMGPSGTTVTFPDDIGLPSIFESKHSR
ncbi:SWR1 complex subunit 2 isoform X1 [Olea europaea subsp. europaea]|uniref:SWR1 complex subunit 2 isoform X1 n=1 Tax=Olea europaea subsp. europaea TaxID=158383 RepID=A0A8S0UL04_OLEEU|nr:SWR1 complex subunit 2 isoform X1 [Olea europaea subsp. europaea]